MCSSSVSLGRNLVSLKWEDFNTFVVSELSALYQKDDLTDVVLWCDGRSFRAHKVLLSLWSSYFREVFRSTTHSHPVVILRETNSIDLELILRFIYQGHLLIPIEDTDRFLKTAEHLQVAGLKNMRNHIPNFNYSATGAGNNGAAGGTTSYHEDNGSVTKVVESTLPQQQHQGPHAAVYDGTVTISSSAQGSPQVIYSTSSSSHSLNSGAAVPPPPHMSPAVTDTHPQYLSSESNGSNQQQVIRQSGSASSSRSAKHTNNAPPPTAYAHTPVAFQSSSPGENLSISSSSRHSSESVIFQQQPQTQPQPVLIFQNGPVSRGSLGGNGRPDHSAPVVVIEGVVPDSSVVHHDSSSNHGNGAGANTYTVYTSSAVGGPIPNPPHHTHHHATIEGPGNEIESQTQIHREETPVKRDSIGHLGTPQQHTLYHHHQHQAYQPTESHHAIVEMDTSTTSSYILPHSYASPTPVSHEAPTQNGGISPTATFTVTATKSKPMIVESTPPPPPPPPPVYAVKRVPPLLPPSPPPPQTPSSSSETRASFKNASPTKNATSPTKKGTNFTQQEISCIATRSKSTAGGTKTLSSSTRNSTTSQMTATRNNLNKDDNKRFTSPNSSGFSNTPTSSSTSTPAVNRKVVLVPCPKCGKKVKQTSLKVHLKRSHLEEGTVLVCPICSKRISSKGVYYKHMYIHRKRSETPGKSPQSPQVAATSNTHAMKSEPQEGT